MMALFYSFFIFLTVLFLFFGIFLGFHFGFKRAILRQYLNIKRDLRLGRGNLRKQWSIFLVVSLLIATALSWFLTGHLIFGLGASIFVPAFFRFFVSVRNKQQRKGIRESTLSFFYALSGLIKTGQSLPSALMDLAGALNSPFASEFAKHLEKYDSGKSLPFILGRLRFRLDGDLSALYLSMLEMIYSRGLSVGPFLDRMIPLLEADGHHRAQVANLLKEVFVQMVVAILIPWILVFALMWFNPELFNELVHQSSTFWTVLIVLGIETTGAWVLWRLSIFY